MEHQLAFFDKNTMNAQLNGGFDPSLSDTLKVSNTNPFIEAGLVYNYENRG